MLGQVAAVNVPREPVNRDAPGDMVPGVVEGGLRPQWALRENNNASQQIMLSRTFLKQFFAPTTAAA